MPESLPMRLPRLPLRSFPELVACAEADELHSDRCLYMGGTARPCTCEVSRTIRMLAAVYGDLLAGDE